MKHQQHTTDKSQQQLDAAQEAIDVLRAENARLHEAVRNTLRFHDGCICRHARRFLSSALASESYSEPATQVISEITATSERLS